MDTPNLGGNAFYLACYAVLLPPQILLGIRYKTWGFLFGVFCGLVLEVVGYTARIQLHYRKDTFVMYLVCLTIGPAFFSAAIYLCLARIIEVYGTHLSRFRPRTYTITFMVSDFIALVFQASGGAILGRRDPAMTDIGLAIIQTGLAAHLIGIAAFVILAVQFGIKTYKGRGQWNPKFDSLQKSRKFHCFLISLAGSTLCIFVRTAFRVAELSQGLNSKLANDEVAFMLLEGAMVVIAATCITASHPGVAFQGRWGEADFQLRSRKEKDGFQEALSRTVPLGPIETL